jgi:predicted acylesterase/phospholipase RssA
MRLRNKLISSLALLTVLFAITLARASDPLTVRVGVISYEDFGKTFDDYKGIFSKLSKSMAGGRPVTFRIAVGTYGDVLDWYNRNLIDLALLTPEPVAELMSSVGGADKLRDLYIASRATTPEPVRGIPKYDYRSVCVVSNTSPVRSFEQLEEWAQKGKVKFLFVHPLSVSGAILPRYLLKQRNITNIGGDNLQAEGSELQNPIVWTFGHDQSLNLLTETDESHFNIDNPDDFIQVAFISERDLQGKGRVIPFQVLDTQRIPQEVVLINKKFVEHKRLLKDLFIGGISKGAFKDFDNWIEPFEEVREWVNDTGVSSHDVAAQRISLSQIGDGLRNFESRYKKPARLALVLSGGGAKCSYQLGAIEALESELQMPLKDETREKKVDIDLVVGTSGGAINALCVALGLTRTPDDQQNLEKTWESFDQRRFFRPWYIVRILLGILIGMIQAMIILRLALWFARNKREFWTGGAIIFFALIDLVLVLLAWNPPWKWMGSLGKKHLLHHLWLVSSLNLDVSGIFLLVVGAAILLIAWRWPGPDDRLRSAYHTSKTVLACWVALLIGAALFVENTLSKSEGVERSLAQDIPPLLKNHPNLKNALELDPQQEQPLQYISSEIMKQGLLRRDLIITGSRLSADNSLMTQSSGGEMLPQDLYFYYDHKTDGAAGIRNDCDQKTEAELPVDPRFRPFGSALLDVVVGSSSIYPFFPSKPVPLMGIGSAAGDAAHVEIIDGGFAHNSPIEAASLWGATHIILIEASPEVSPRHQNFLDNAVAAFNHLYLQAQLVDAHSRGRVEIYTLRPALAGDDEVPNLCVFDFSDLLIQIAISNGRNDALDDSRPRFHRESGEPYFRDAVLPAKCDIAEIAKNTKPGRKDELAIHNDARRRPASMD